MNIGEYSVRRPVVSWLLVIIMVGGGIYGFNKMGKLEDPNFTIKQAKIITYYPGATAQEVQDEVTYHLEDAVQLKRIKMSISRPGLSDITLEFKDEYTANRTTSSKSPLPRPHLNQPDPRPWRSEVSRLEAGYSVDWAAKSRRMAVRHGHWPYRGLADHRRPR